MSQVFRFGVMVTVVLGAIILAALGVTVAVISANCLADESLAVVVKYGWCLVGITGLLIADAVLGVVCGVIHGILEC